MKNIHVIPTDKPSRLYLTTHEYIFEEGYSLSTDECENKHIYITSDEEIKEGDYVCASGGFRFVKTLNNDKFRTFKDDGIVSKQNPSSSCHLSNYKKIILTTDQDLIKDGVQPIDDEFLEWFVQNPSCEEVKIESTYKDFNPITYTHKIIIPKEENVNPKNQEVMFHQERQEYFYEDFVDGKIVTVWLGKDYITKEEPKQRLEKYSERFDNDKSPIGNPATWGKRMVEEPEHENCCTPIGQIKRYVDCKGCDRKPKQEILLEDVFNEEKKKGVKELIDKQETLEEAAWRVFGKDDDNFYDGAKWQQERSYSEEEVLPIVEYIQWVIRKIDKGNTPEEIVRLLLFNKEKIEQFKKK